MTGAEQIAKHLARSLPNVKAGAIRMWGVRFGASGDNGHTVIFCKSVNECLRIGFDEGEILSVWSPRNWEISADVFRIDKAEHVRWEWYYYGRPAKPKNLYYVDLIFAGKTIAGSSNVDWCQPDLRADAGLPAAEIV